MRSELVVKQARRRAASADGNIAGWRSFSSPLDLRLSFQMETETPVQSSLSRRERSVSNPGDQGVSNTVFPARRTA